MLLASEMRKLQRSSSVALENMKFNMSVEINGDSLIFNCGSAKTSGITKGWGGEGKEEKEKPSRFLSSEPLKEIEC